MHAGAADGHGGNGLARGHAGGLLAEAGGDGVGRHGGSEHLGRHGSDAGGCDAKWHRVTKGSALREKIFRRIRSSSKQTACPYEKLADLVICACHRQPIDVFPVFAKMHFRETIYVRPESRKSRERAFLFSRGIPRSAPFGRLLLRFFYARLNKNVYYRHAAYDPRAFTRWRGRAPPRP